MSKRLWSSVWALPVGALLAALGGSQARPNIVVLLSDDVVHGSMSAAGHPVLATPNLDRIALEGVRFRNAFVTTSLCSPSRASYLTGLYPRSHGVLDNTTALPSGLDTYASLLSAAGYDTAYFGKWHMGTQSGPRPGFDEGVSYDGQGVYTDCELWRGTEPLATRGHVDDRVTDFALEYLRAPRERPFLVCIGFKSTHGPLEPASRFRGLYTDAPALELFNAEALPPFPVEPASEPVKNSSAARQRLYCRAVAQLDECVGRVLDTLDELQLSDHTVVVYASDNGFLVGQHGLPAGKRVAYEESIRVDLAMRAPGLGDPGRVIDDLVLNVDLAPTLLELAGLRATPRMQGRSLAPLLRGESVDWRCDFLYEYVQERRSPVPTLEALYSVCREGQAWKLIRYPGHPDWTELFELSDDPFETRNLWAATRAEPLAVELQARLEELITER